MDETEGVRKGSAAPSSTDQDKRISHNLIRHILGEIMSRDQGAWQAGGSAAEISKDLKDPLGSKAPSLHCLWPSPRATSVGAWKTEHYPPKDSQLLRVASCYLKYKKLRQSAKLKVLFSNSPMVTGYDGGLRKTQLVIEDEDPHFLHLSGSVDGFWFHCTLGRGTAETNSEPWQAVFLIGQRRPPPPSLAPSA